MKDKKFRPLLQAAAILLLFLVISYAFVPQVLGGKIVNQSDISGWTGMTHEVTQYNEAHPEDKAFWTNSMFGGMPTISMYGDFKGDWTGTLYDLLLTGARPASYLFISLIGGWLLMLAFGMNSILAIGGAIAFTFCSYNMQIIQVGHNTKMQAIAYMPWVLAALVYTYRSVLSGSKDRKWIFSTLLGSTLFAFALSFQIKANHPQISYYLAIIIFGYALTLLIWLLTSKERRQRIGRFFAASALLLVIGLTGVATNLNKLLPTYEYAAWSMRGGSELQGTGEKVNKDGLDMDYATAWSYGMEETPNLMIPNFNGGSSAGNPGLRNSETYDLLRQARQPNVDQVMDSLPLYWGPQPFTAGPMYLGAISIFLFFLGLFLLEGKEKWWLLAVTVIAVFMAWGSHFMGFTRLCFNYLPLYNKFRTVSMALVILQVTVPLMGFLCLKQLLDRKGPGKKDMRSMLAAYLLTGGVCVLFALFPGLAGDFKGSADAGMQQVLSDALAADRQAMLAKDALRSFIFITLAAALLFWGSARKDGKDRRTAVAAIMALFILLDLGAVDKRYLNGDHFVSRKDFSSQFQKRPVDQIILEDKDLDYRVLDLSTSTFNDSHTSYWHKSIGGYSPAKLQRYQDLIQHYISPEINAIYRSAGKAGTISGMEESLPEIPVISMLNGRYIIIDGNYPPLKNAGAYGNCWFVDRAADAETPDQEISLIGSTDLRNTAVIGRDFSWASSRISSLAPADDARDHMELVSYAPHELRYQADLSQERAVIFSEIYYPEGWTLTIDGHPADLFRADWILRGAFIPEGSHDIVMRYDPQVYKTGERFSRASSITLILLLLLAGGGMVWSRSPRKKD